MIKFLIKDVHMGDKLYCINNIGNYKKGEIYTVSDTSFFELFHKIKGENCLPIECYFIHLPKKEEIEDELGYKIKIVSKQ